MPRSNQKWCAHPISHQGARKSGPGALRPRGNRPIYNDLAAFITQEYYQANANVGFALSEAGLLCTATARSIKWSIFRYFWLHLPKKMYDVPKSHVGFLKARSQENLTPPPTAHICSDRSFVALSNVISHYVQSSLLMEFLGLENTAIKRVSRELPSSDGSKKILNISILIALIMRNPNLSSEFL